MKLYKSIWARFLNGLYKYESKVNIYPLFDEFATIGNNGNESNSSDDILLEKTCIQTGKEVIHTHTHIYLYTHTHTHKERARTDNYDDSLFSNRKQTTTKNTSKTNSP